VKLNVTIPVFNEERRLERGIRQLAPFLAERMTGDYELVIAENASTDGTPAIARRLVAEFPGVRVVRLEAKGRGGALRHVWSTSEAEVCSYMDVDLSSDLGSFPELVRAVASGGADLAVGSRLLRTGGTQRSWQREVLSRGYNRLLRAVFNVRFSDAQCGFKVVSRRAAQTLLPLVENNHWFFDTELLVLAEKAGFRIHDLPVRWQEDRDSTVKVLRTVGEDLRGIARLRGRLRKRAWQTGWVNTQLQATPATLPQPAKP
jgi:glycosyltransferase involved in cell wall biosynthesis